MAAKISGEDSEPIADINIVPFVDIILVVLIIFMIAAPFVEKSSIKLNLPKAASGEDTKPSQLTVYITAAGKAFIDGKPVTDKQISSSAHEMAIKKPNTQAIISADKDSLHGRVVQVIDLIKTAGINRFAITVDKTTKP